MKHTLALTLLSIVLFTSSLYANSHKSRDKMMPMMPMNLTAEQRQGMATVHEKMAVCLKSDKSMEVCHTEMKATCKEMMGDQGCHVNAMKDDKMMKDKKY